MPDETAAHPASESPTRPLPPVVGDATGGRGWSEHVRLIGGLVAVTVGVVAITIITLVALGKNSETAGTIASATGGVIASIVGAFFGVKIGTDQTRNAVEGERRQAARAAVFAAHLPPEKAASVLDQAESIATGRRAPEPRPKDG